MRGLAAIAVALIVSAASSAASGPGTAVLHPTASIALKGYAHVIADGRRAAAVGPCGIVQWSPGQRRGAFTDPCRPLSGLDDSDAYDFAIAGDRLAWLREEWVSHGMVVQSELVVKTGTGKPREVASAYNEYEEGTWLLGLAGGGDTLAVGWTNDTFPDGGVPEHDEKVFRVAERTAGATTCPHASGLLPNPAAARLCVDSGLPGGKPIAAAGDRVLGRYFGKLYVADPSGQATKLTIHDTALATLSGTQIVIVRTGKQSALELWDAKSGTIRSRRSLPPLNGSVGKLTVGGHFASFWSRGLHLVSLKDGRDRIVKIAGGTPVHGALTSAGLFVLYRVKGGERLGFVPLARL
jgi:hypothetical protein